MAKFALVFVPSLSKRKPVSPQNKADAALLDSWSFFFSL